MLAVFASVAGGAIWLGAVSKQVEINTGRLSKVENFLDDVRQHDANTSAQEAAFDRRLTHLEQMKEVKP